MISFVRPALLCLSGYILGACAPKRDNLSIPVLPVKSTERCSATLSNPQKACKPDDISNPTPRGSSSSTQIPTNSEDVSKTFSPLPETAQPSNIETSKLSQGASGRPYCQTNYYGDVYFCSDKKQQKCAKSDSDYKLECELTGDSKHATTAQGIIGPSLHPYCGPEIFGDKFEENGYKFAKSDREYKTYCQVVE